MENTAIEQRRLNAEKVADQLFPGEKWINASSVKLKYSGEEFDLPSRIDNVKVAQSRLTGEKDDERTLAKEIKQAKILADKGDTIFLIPKQKDEDGNDIKGPDATRNGVLFEFKNITGSLDRVEMRFRESRTQCKNVYLKVDNPNISKDDVISKIRSILRDKKYKKGTEGLLIFYLEGTQKTYYFKIDDLK